MEVFKETTGDKVVKVLEGFLAEMEASYARATLIVLKTDYFEALKKDYPYLIDGDYFLYRKDRIRVILSQNDIISVGMSYYTLEEEQEGYTTFKQCFIVDVEDSNGKEPSFK